MEGGGKGRQLGLKGFLKDSTVPVDALEDIAKLKEQFVPPPGWEAVRLKGRAADLDRGRTSPIHRQAYQSPAGRVHGGHRQ
jgi:hypothetical protein